MLITDHDRHGLKALSVCGLLLVKSFEGVPIAFDFVSVQRSIDQHHIGPRGPFQHG